MSTVSRPGTGRKWCSAIGVVLLGVGLAVAGSGPVQAAASTAHVALTAKNLAAARAAATAVPSTGGTYVALTPHRILDTRTGLGGYTKIAPQSTADVQVGGRGGVPASGVAAVVVQVTAVGATAPGFVTVHPSDAGRPVVSNLNFVPGLPSSNLVTVRVSAGGRIDLYNGSAGSTHLVLDVQGYYRSGVANAPGAFHALTPARILDTRGNNGAAGPVAAAGTVGLQVAGRGGVPASGVAAVAVNVTAVTPAATGYLTVHPGSSTRPSTSSLNFGAGQNVANLVIVPLGANGKINLYNGSAGQVQLIADVQGYYLSGASTVAGSFRALSPRRILDTRNGLGGSTRAAAGAETKIHVNGAGGVPAAGVSAVVLNITAVGPASSGSLVAFPTGVLEPTASNLNLLPGRTHANLVIVPVDSFGWVSLANNSGGPVDQLADVAGYYLGKGIDPTVLGPFSYGPFTMGMTMAQAEVVYPALNPTAPTTSMCGSANLPQALFLFNRGTTQLSWIRPTGTVQTANGIRFGDTVGSVLSRFPWASLTPTEPPLSMTVTKAQQAAAVPTVYWFRLAGARDPVTELAKASNTVTGISLERDQRCFN